MARDPDKRGLTVLVCPVLIIVSVLLLNECPVCLCALHAVITVYDESRAALVDVLQALSRPSPPKLSETHNDMLWQLVSTTLNMRDVRNMSDYVQAVSPQALKKIAGSVADIDSLAAQVGAGLYARRRPRRPLDGERRMRK